MEPTSSSRPVSAPLQRSERVIPTAKPRSALRLFTELLSEADIVVGGDRPWDIQIHDSSAVDRVLASGSLGLGESYMDGMWDCREPDEFIARVLHARLEERVGSSSLIWSGLRARLLNRQSSHRAWQVGEAHYDLGNEFFQAMLDHRMVYSCGYWATAKTLEDAQTAKLDLICRKLGLQQGMRLLDIGCGWGSLMRFAAENYGVRCVGLTISRAQAEFGQQDCRHLPVEFRLEDYRAFNCNQHERFDRVASVGMFEHVGQRNAQAFLRVARRGVTDDGLFLLHTIGKLPRETRIDAWIDQYIFPNYELPSLGKISDECEGLFTIEDVHNFGHDYDPTLMAWHDRFEAAWPRFAERYGERFHRMWRYYLLACAGTFRARINQLWQIVLSPKGVAGAYRRPE